MFFMHFYLFCPGDAVTCMGDWETQLVSARLLDNRDGLVVLAVKRIFQER